MFKPSNYLNSISVFLVFLLWLGNADLDLTLRAEASLQNENYSESQAVMEINSSLETIGIDAFDRRVVRHTTGHIVPRTRYYKRSLLVPYSRRIAFVSYQLNKT